jgi:hypothetical protein
MAQFAAHGLWEPDRLAPVPACRTAEHSPLLPLGKGRSDKTGIPRDLPKVVREAVGFAEPRPEDHVRQGELSVVPAIEVQLSNGRRAYLAEFNAHPLRENGCVF